MPIRSVSQDILPNPTSHIPTELIEKPKSPLRWPVLVLGCLVLIGSYFCFDFPAALKVQMHNYMGGSDEDYETYFALLYTLYAIPNVILPFFGGYFVDRLGVCMSLLIFTSLICIGQVVVCIGFSIKSWPLIFLGRIIFSFGGENLIVADSALLADWFIGREVAFAFGINLSIARVASVIANVTLPGLANSANFLFSLWFGSIICAGSVICVFFIWPLDIKLNKQIAEQKERLRVGTGGKEGDSEVNPLLSSDPSFIPTLSVISGSEGTNEQKQLKDKEKRFLSSEAHGGGVGGGGGGVLEDGTEERGVGVGVGGEDSEPRVSLKDTFSFPHIFWVLVLLCIVVYGCVLPFNNVASTLLQERNYFLTPPVSCHLTYPDQCQNTVDNFPVDCPFESFYQPPLPGNLTVGGIYYPSTLTSLDIDCTNDLWASQSTGCTYEYCSRLLSAENKAAVIMSIPYIISGIMSPIIGYFVDLYGMRAIISTLATLSLVIVHFILGLAPSVGPEGPLVGQGLAYTGFAAVLWPAIPLVIEKRLSGLGFGIVTAALNLGCAILPLVVAAIYNDSGSLYIPNVELLFASLGIVGFSLGLYLNYYDSLHEYVLNKGDRSLGDDLVWGWEYCISGGKNNNSGGKGGSGRDEEGGVDGEYEKFIDQDRRRVSVDPTSGSGKKDQSAPEKQKEKERWFEKRGSRSFSEGPQRRNTRSFSTQPRTSSLAGPSSSFSQAYTPPSPILSPSQSSQQAIHILQSTD